MTEHKSMMARRCCPRCDGRDIWEAPEVADETWQESMAMPAAWRQNGTPMGHLEVCACGSCGLVEWHSAALGELEADDAGVSLSEEGETCRMCDHPRLWRVERVRDVRSVGQTKELEAHTRGLTYSVRGKREPEDEPIVLAASFAADEAGRVRPLETKERVRNLLSYGALHGRAVGHLELRICAACGYTDWYAHGAAEAKGDGEEIDHACAACDHARALRMRTFDLRIEGVNAKRVALGRSAWGTTRADMDLRICLGCSRAEWFVADTASLEADAHGLVRTERDEGVGVYRRAGREDGRDDDAPERSSRSSSRKDAGGAAAAQPFGRAFWLTVAAASAAVALFVLLHPLASIAPLPLLLGWLWTDNQRRKRGRIAEPEPRPARIAAAEDLPEDEAADDEPADEEPASKEVTEEEAEDEEADDEASDEVKRRS